MEAEVFNIKNFGIDKVCEKIGNFIHTYNVVGLNTVIRSNVDYPTYIKKHIIEDKATIFDIHSVNKCEVYKNSDNIISIDLSGRTIVNVHDDTEVAVCHDKLIISSRATDTIILIKGGII